MFGFFRGLWLVVLLALVGQGAWAFGGSLRPSDCRARDADSTCALAVPGATTSPVPPFHQDGTLYDGVLAGVPALGYSYWGYDFIADQAGTPSPVRPDEFINRSKVPVTITLSFTVPQRATCGHDCLPGVEFRLDVGWHRVDPPYVKVGSTVSLTTTIQPNQGYSWIIGLWQASDPRITVTVPKNSAATLADVGLVAGMGVSNRIPAVDKMCDCGDGTVAQCSDGERYSNGLLGEWSTGMDGYTRGGAYTSCVAPR